MRRKGKGFQPKNSPVADLIPDPLVILQSGCVP